MKPYKGSFTWKSIKSLILIKPSCNPLKNVLTSPPPANFLQVWSRKSLRVCSAALWFEVCRFKAQRLFLSMWVKFSISFPSRDELCLNSVSSLSRRGSGRWMVIRKARGNMGNGVFNHLFDSELHHKSNYTWFTLKYNTWTKLRVKVLLSTLFN